MGVQINTIELGVGNIHVIQDKGTVVVDAGDTDKRKEFIEGLEKMSLNPKDIKLVVITHGHFDHIGTAADIRELTGAKIAMHEKEKKCLEKGLMPQPPGLNLWGTMVAGLIKVAMVPFRKIKPTSVDIVLDDSEVSLSEYGIQGSIIHTPGHSAGSVSVLLETGDAFVGDLAMNAFPLRINPGLPVFGDNIETIKSSWSLLLEKGAKKVYPGHGDPFPVSVIEKALAVN